MTASGNALGIQIATNANAFLNDPATIINATDNLSVGLTVVSGAHLVSFGGKINVSGNPVAGVSVNSKAGLDLDAGSTLTSSNNGAGVLIQEASVMTVFNTPQFSGVPGFSTVNAHDNTGDGVRVQTGSTLTLSNQARIVSHAERQNRVCRRQRRRRDARQFHGDREHRDGHSADVRHTRRPSDAHLRLLHVRRDRPRPRNERHHLPALRAARDPERKRGG